MLNVLEGGNCGLCQKEGGVEYCDRRKDVEYGGRGKVGNVLAGLSSGIC